MKKIITILSLVLLFSVQTKAQFSVGYSFGYGSYQMGDMKDLLKSAQNMMNSQYPGFDAQIVDNFPGYMIHTLDLGYRMKQHEFGIKSTYQTTGGKLSRADYSGEYEEQITLTSFREGFFYRNYFYTKSTGNQSSLSLFGEISPALIFSSLKTKGHLSIGDETQNMEEVKASNTSFAVLPQVGVKFNINSYIGFLVSTGYDFNFGSGVSNLGGLKMDWSGFRVAGGVACAF